MSRKTRMRQKQTVSTPLFIMMFGGALLVAAGIFFGIQNFSNTDGNGTPILSVDQELIDYGDVALETNLTFKIKVTNVGDGTLRFREQPYVQVLEGC